VISHRDPAADRRLALERVATALAIVSLAFTVLILIEDSIFLINGDPGAFLFSLSFVLLVANLAIVGGLLATRRPENVIGWLLLVAGLLEAIGIAGSINARLDALFGGGRLPFVVPGAWLGSWLVPPAIGILVVVLPLVFPSGHLPGPRWRYFLWFAIVAMTIGVISSATAPGPLDGIDGLVNPLLLPPPIGDWIQTLGQVSQTTAVFGFLIAVGSLVMRFRRSHGIERRQIKWYLFAASVSATFLAVSIVFGTGLISDTAWILGLVTMAFVPIAIGVAVLRYRLYEIDRIVSRAVGYAFVTAAVVILFVGVVLVAEALLAPFTQANSLAVAASTLVVASVFQPLRRAIQRIVDRRFDRSKVDADRAVALLADRLRAAVDLDGMRADVLQTVDGTVRPTTARIWLRQIESRSQES
jgi:hypothetical protein